MSRIGPGIMSYGDTTKRKWHLEQYARLSSGGPSKPS